MRILIGVDDTDNADSFSTGELLEQLCAALRDDGLGRTGYITRHQLYVHEDISYTTHNSTMCCDADIEDVVRVVDFCSAYISSFGAEGADPGLCIIDLGKLTHRKRIIRFGFAAKNLVLTKRDALEVAQLHERAVQLLDLGGTGGGVIGAMAACGLRLSGKDGTLGGKLRPPQGNKVITVGELCRMHALSCAMTPENCTANLSDTVYFCCPTKAALINHRPGVYLARDRSGKADWCVYGIQKLIGLVD